jgi:hypothetical protein
MGLRRRFFGDCDGRIDGYFELVVREPLYSGVRCAELTERENTDASMGNSKFVLTHLNEPTAYQQRRRLR